MATTDSIRKDVGKKIATSIKDYSSKEATKSTLRRLDSAPKGRNFAIFRAAAEVQRTTGKSRSPESLSTETRKTYAAAVQHLAEMRGIKPAEEETGQFSTKQLQEELSPEEIMKFAASRYMKEQKDADVPLETARNELSQTIQEVYNGEESQVPEETKTFISKAPVYVTDDEFLNLKEDEQNAYMESLGGCEKERLAELLKEKSKELSKDDIAKAKMNYNDPDWGHHDDKDDFKIESGDIIEYLMKDVILAGTAWALNKPAGFVGTLAYETCHHGLHEAINLWDEWRRGKEEKKDQGKPTPPPPVKESLLAITQNTEESLKPFERDLEKFRSKTEEQISQEQEWLRRLAKQYVAIKEDGSVKYFDGKDYVSSHFDPSSEEFKALRETQDKLRNLARDHLKDSVEQKDEEKVLNAYDDYSQKVKEAVLAEKKPGDPDFPKMPTDPANFSELWQASHQKAVDDIRLEQVKKQLEVEKTIFCAYYGQHQLLEHYKKNKDNENCRDFDSPESIQAFLDEREKEAAVLFYTAQKQRSEKDSTGKKNPKGIPSNKELIAMAKGQHQKSLDDVKNDRTEPVEDKTKETIAPPKEKEKLTTLTEEANDNVSRLTFLDHQRDNINIEIKSLETLTDENSQRRKRALEAKSHILGEVVASSKPTQTVGKVYKAPAPRGEQR